MIRSLLHSTGIAICLTFVLSAAGFAKDPVGYEDVPVYVREHPDFTPPDIIMGSFIVRPVLETIGWYDSNVFLDKDNEVGDFAVSIRPSLVLKSNFSRHALNFKLDSDYIHYNDETDQDTLDIAFLADGRIDFFHDLALSGGVSIAEDHEDRNDSTTPSSPLEPTETKARIGFLSLDYAPNRFNLSLFGSYSINKYENGVTRATHTRLVEEDRNVKIATAGTRLAYDMYENYTPYVVAKVEDHRFDHNQYDTVTADFTGKNQDKTLYSLAPGIEFEYKELLFGHLQVGIGYEKSEDAGTANKKTYLIDAEVTWNPTKLTSVKAQLNRSFDTDSTTDAGTVLTTANATVYHELKRNFIVGAGTELTWRDYDNSARLDRIYGLKLDGEYRVNDHFSINGGYVLNRRLSETTAFDYTQNLFFLGLKQRF